MKFGFGATRPDAADELSLFDIHQLLEPRRRCRARIRRLCHTIRLDDCVLCRVLGRYMMFVDIHDTALAPHLMLDGIWELATTRAVLRHVRPGMTAVDVGANQGYYTVLLADLVGPAGRVYAAEPNPGMMSLLQRSIAVNGFEAHVTCLGQPLSATPDETVLLHVPQGRPQNASIAGCGGGTSQFFSLSTTTLDAVVGDGPVDFVKVDVEGAEEAVWAGMGRILARNAPLTVFLEFTPDRYRSPADFLQRMLGSGLSLGVVDSTGDVRPISTQEVVAGAPNVDRMLVMTR